MKREYRAADELGKQRSVRKFQELAEQGASVQLMLPLAEVLQMVQDGCGQLLREAGLRLMTLVMEEEAEPGRASCQSGGEADADGVKLHVGA